MLLEIDNPFGPDCGIVRVLEPTTASGALIGHAIADGTYAKPFIVDEGTTRSLYFNMANIQCVMNTGDPDGLVLAYTRAMTAFLLFHPEPARIAIVGLGGGSLAKFCYRYLPRTDISTLEIDADIIALRDAFRVPPDDDRFRVIHADGADYVARARGLDVLLIDAYDRGGLAPSLTGASFYADVAANLAPEGLFVMNLCGRRRAYAAVVEHVAAAFRGRLVELPARRDGNVVLYAFKSPGNHSRAPASEIDARALKRRFGFDFPRYAARLNKGLADWSVPRDPE